MSVVCTESGEGMWCESAWRVVRECGVSVHGGRESVVVWCEYARRVQGEVWVSVVRVCTDSQGVWCACARRVVR